MSNKMINCVSSVTKAGVPVKVGVSFHPIASLRSKSTFDLYKPRSIWTNQKSVSLLESHQDRSTRCPVCSLRVTQIRCLVSSRLIEEVHVQIRFGRLRWHKFQGCIDPKNRSRKCQFVGTFMKRNKIDKIVGHNQIENSARIPPKQRKRFERNSKVSKLSPLIPGWITAEIVKNAVNLESCEWTAPKKLFHQHLPQILLQLTTSFFI